MLEAPNHMRPHIVDCAMAERLDQSLMLCLSLELILICKKCSGNQNSPSRRGVDPCRHPGWGPL
jgi:hypothetical protein